MASLEDRRGQELFRPHQHGPLGASAGERDEAAEVDHVAGAVLDSGDARLVEGPAHGVDLEGHLREGRHVVQEERQPQLGEEVPQVLPQLRLALGHVVGRGQDHGVGARARGVTRQGDRLDEGGIRDSDQDGRASAHLGGHAADHVASEPMAQAGAFAGRAEDEDAGHARVEDVLDHPLEAGGVERVAVEERGDDGRHDSTKRPRSVIRARRPGWRARWGRGRGGCRRSAGRRERRRRPRAAAQRPRTSAP